MLPHFARTARPIKQKETKPDNTQKRSIEIQLSSNNPAEPLLFGQQSQLYPFKRFQSIRSSVARYKSTSGVSFTRCPDRSHRCARQFSSRTKPAATPRNDFTRATYAMNAFTDPLFLVADRAKWNQLPRWSFCSRFRSFQTRVRLCSGVSARLPDPIGDKRRTHAIEIGQGGRGTTMRSNTWKVTGGA